MKSIYTDKHGFTIIELMIATTIFTMVLLVCALAITHVGRMYYKGIITGRTQDTSRKVVDEISQSIQFGSGPRDPDDYKEENINSFGGVEVKSICLGSVRYSYNDDYSLGSGGTATNQIRHVLWRDETTDATCPPVDLTQASLSGGEELLGSNMRLPVFTVSHANNLWTISLRVTYGNEPQLYEGSNQFRFCKGSTAGGQFCATSEFTTSVMRRLSN